jgi:hypothetical protein
VYLSLLPAEDNLPKHISLSFDLTTLLIEII